MMEFKSVLYMLVVVVATFEYGSTDPGSQGYFYLRATGVYYKYHTERTTWQEAKAGCEREGATLFIPGSLAEIKEVISLLRVRPTEYIHVGITDSEARGTYKTLDGLLISSVFGKWGSGYPTPGDNMCVKLYISESDHYLGTWGCHWLYPYICKIQEHVGKDVLMTAKEIKTVIANSSDSIIEAMQSQAASQATVLQSLSDSLANQATSAARKTEMMQREMAATHREITGMHQHMVNQTVLLTRLAESVGMLVEVTRNQTSSITALMQRQVHALEKLQEDNNNINVRSDQ